MSRDADSSKLQALLAPARAGEPRIAPARPRELGLLARAVAVITARMTGTGPPNVFTTLGRHPRLFRAWLRYSAHLMPFGTLPRPDTELVILRVAWRCRSAYEWHQHVPLALRVGLTADEVAGAAGESHGFTARRQALLAAADELLADRALTDTTWRAVRDALSERETIELFLLVGHYQGLATALGGLRIQVEEAVRPLGRRACERFAEHEGRAARNGPEPPPGSTIGAMTAELRHRQVALVTGASAGIGLAIAQVLAEEGFDLVLVARRAPELKKLARSLEVDHGARVVVLAMDLLREGAGQDLEEALGREGLAIEILVNNAGLVEVGAFREIEVERHLRLIQLNVAVLTELSRRFLPAMVARGHGRILNVASLSAFQPVPSLAVYAATKAFVLSLTESLSEELKGTGVSVTALCPGLVRTHMVEQAKEGSVLARLAPDFLLSDAAAVAREGVEACLAGRVIDVPGAPNRLTAHLVRFYPRWVVRTIVGLVGRRAL